MNIIYEYGPSGKCPVQAEGTIDGLPFYFRARGGHWSLSIAKTPGGNTLDYANCHVYAAPYDGIHLDEPQILHGMKVQFGAGWAEPEECITFIEGAAKILLPEKENPGMP